MPDKIAPDGAAGRFAPGQDEHSLESLLRGRLSKGRYRHSLNVAGRAAELARLHGADVEKARFAGLMHDVCKDMPKKEQLVLIERGGIVLSSEVLASPQLYHAIAGSVYLRDALKVQDQEILDAVRYHTTGRAGMSLLEEVVYLADLTSAERDYPDAQYTRELADRDVAKAMLYSFQFIIRELAGGQKPLCRETIDGYNYYVRRLRAQSAGEARS